MGQSIISPRLLLHLQNPRTEPLEATEYRAQPEVGTRLENFSNNFLKLFISVLIGLPSTKSILAFLNNCLITPLTLFLTFIGYLIN